MVTAVLELQIQWVSAQIHVGNIFIFCIQESHATGSNVALPMCPFLRRVSEVFQDNDDIIFGVDFGDGVSNPLTFHRSGTWPVSQEYLYSLIPMPNELGMKPDQGRYL